MTRLQRQKGFTLVELAIVMTIIGLLIGGILKGQQLMLNARVTATIAQVHATEAALTTFRDTYNGMPGDLANGNTRINSCNAACDSTAPGVGDGIVGSPTWDMTTFQSAPVAAAAITTNAAETVVFWFEMARAGLITGVTSDGVNGGVGSFGTSLPAAKVGGGFTVGYSNGAAARIGFAGAYSIAGHVLALAQAPAALTGTAGIQVLPPTLAAQIDRKLDDGMPATGDVQAYGLGTTCYSVVAPGTATAPVYLESIPSKDCGLFFRIQG